MKIKSLITTIIICASLIGCGTLTTSQKTALIGTATNLAVIAASAAGQYYGGSAGGTLAGSLASAGLSGLATVAQAYVGSTIPPSIVVASPGVNGVGQALVQQFAPNHTVTQADVNKLNQAADIAAALKTAVIIPPSVAQ
jgi:hypothetical protein